MDLRRLARSCTRAMPQAVAVAYALREHTRCSCEVQQEHVVPASDATLAACSASLAHALQELWRARVWGCSLYLAGSDPFTISIMSGPQKIAHR